MKTNHCPYLVKYLFDLIKEKTKVLDTFNTDKKINTNYYRMKSLTYKDNEQGTVSNMYQSINHCLVRILINM